jgi:hypothetical protein
MPERSAEEIRSSIEANRAQLAVSVGRLRGEIDHLADWRGHLARHRTKVLIGAAVTGFVVGGGRPHQMPATRRMVSISISAAPWGGALAPVFPFATHIPSPRPPNAQ